MERINLVAQTNEKVERLCYETPRVSTVKVQKDIVTASKPTDGNGKVFYDYSEDNWF